MYFTICKLILNQLRKSSLQHLNICDFLSTDMQKQHETNLEEITMRFENIKVTLHEKVEFLRAECDEMKRREKMYMDKCKVDSDCKVQVCTNCGMGRSDR